MEPNGPAILAAILIILGVTTNPSALVAGLIWALFLCLVACWTLGIRKWWVYLIMMVMTIFVAIFASIIWMGLPFFGAIGMTGSMAIIGGLTPLWLKVLTGIGKINFSKLIAAILTKKLGK